MNSKLDKYYNHIVNDLIKRTEMDYEEEEIELPFFSSYSSFASLTHTFMMPPTDSFIVYVRDMYGVSGDEMQLIWDMYRGSIRSFIRRHHDKKV
jgi:hypothetical protein